VYYSEKYPQLKLMNIYNNSETLLVNPWYFKILVSLVGPTFYAKILTINSNELKYSDYWNIGQILMDLIN
jgi:hypothetical protein